MNRSVKTSKKSAIFLKDLINPDSIQIGLKRYHRCAGGAELRHSEMVISMRVPCAITHGCLAGLGCRRNQTPPRTWPGSAALVRREQECLPSLIYVASRSLTFLPLISGATRSSDWLMWSVLLRIGRWVLKRRPFFLGVCCFDRGVPCWSSSLNLTLACSGSSLTKPGGVTTVFLHATNIFLFHFCCPSIPCPVSCLDRKRQLGCCSFRSSPPCETWAFSLPCPPKFTEMTLWFPYAPQGTCRLSLGEKKCTL